MSDCIWVFSTANSSRTFPSKSVTLHLLPPRNLHLDSAHFASKPLLFTTPASSQTLHWKTSNKSRTRHTSSRNTAPPAPPAESKSSAPDSATPGPKHPRQPRTPSPFSSPQHPSLGVAPFRHPPPGQFPSRSSTQAAAGSQAPHPESPPPFAAVQHPPHTFSSTRK
jgi:hypothetical protein